MEKYNPKEYWNLRDNPVKGTLPFAITEFVKEHLRGAVNILDFGSGRGRLFPYMHGNVTAYDIADHHQKHFVTDHLNSFRYITVLDSALYDVAVCSEVLLHIPTEEEVREILETLSTVADKVIIISYYEQINKPLALHCFKWEYERILKDMGFDIVHKMDTKDRVCITYKVKK